MDIRILIVEDEFIVANDLKLMLESAGYEVSGIAGSVEQAKEMMAKQKPQLVLLDIHLRGEETGIDLARHLSDEHIAFVYLSANSNQKILEAAKATQPYGFLVKPFREKDILVTLEIAWYLHEQNMLLKRNNEIALQNTLTDIVSQPTEWDEKFLKIAKTIQPSIPFDFVAIGMKNMEKENYHGLCFLRLNFDEYQIIGLKELMVMTGIPAKELPKYQDSAPEDSISAFYNAEDFVEICNINPAKKIVSKTFHLYANLVMYIPVSGKAGFTFSFYSRKADIYTKRHLALVKRLAGPLSKTIEGILSAGKNARVPELNLRPAEKIAAKKSVIKNVDGIIGNSHLLLTALDLITIVAPLETSVLILGESGTGKEKFARSIHQQSARSKKQMVVVNCAALPVHLIESELFGHEKGAFTGAVDRRIGKFEQAAGGTIFLDEMGELPLESQAKLLRVLQEKEIERLGGRETIKVDVRIIVATNCNLEKEVAAGRFRLDLYYRLNVFPILLPPLRDRKEDIPLLVRFFLDKYVSLSGREDITVSNRAMEDLQRYNWPGNVRELEHLIERNVLLARGKCIERISLPNHQHELLANDQQPGHVKSIDDNERDHILAILSKCEGRISGKGGAAELLDVPSTTLNSKMKRLGITRRHFS